MFKSGFVAIIGKPNVGKSTLINAIIGEKVSIVSPKENTTRDKIMGVYNTEETQIVFIDTPGFLKPKNKLDEYMGDSIKSSIHNVDVLLIVLDGLKPFKDEDMDLIEKHLEGNIPVIVVVNKIDATSFEKLYPKLSKLNLFPKISAIMPLSALRKKNIKPLIEEIEKHLKDTVKYFDTDTYTDKTQRFMASEIIREKTLWLLREEIPQGIAIDIQLFKEEEGLTTIDANIICDRQAHKQIIVGHNGSMIKRIGTEARIELEKLLDCKKIFLKLFVKVKPNWKAETATLNSLGYNKKDIS